MDISTDNGLCMEHNHLVKYSCVVIVMDDGNIDLLNIVYKDLSEEFGMDIAMKMYQRYKGTQVSYPMRFFNPDLVKDRVIKEFNGDNLKQLAVKYNYSEKTIRRMIHKSLKGR